MIAMVAVVLSTSIVTGRPLSFSSLFERENIDAAANCKVGFDLYDHSFHQGQGKSQPSALWGGGPGRDHTGFF